MILARRLPVVLSLGGLAGFPAWGMLVPAAPLVCASCLVSETSMFRPEFVRAVDIDSDKGVSIVHNPRLDTHEPGPVPQQAVATAMLSSGLFGEDDVKSLAGPIAAEMPRMLPREQMRIVGWAEDGPRVYYVLIHGGKLRLAYHKGDQELERHEAIIPSEAVAMGSVPEPPSLKGRAPGEAPAPSSTTTTASAAPTAAPKPVAVAPPRPRPAGPPPAPLTEEEARRKIRTLDEMLSKNLITAAEHKRSKREILIRL